MRSSANGFFRSLGLLVGETQSTNLFGGPPPFSIKHPQDNFSLQNANWHPPKCKLGLYREGGVPKKVGTLVSHDLGLAETSLLRTLMLSLFGLWGSNRHAQVLREAHRAAKDTNSDAHVCPPTSQSIFQRFIYGVIREVVICRKFSAKFPRSSWRSNPYFRKFPQFIRRISAKLSAKTPSRTTP